MIQAFGNHVSLIALSVGALALPAGPALAQDGAAGADTAATTGGASEIIVTAQRRSERLVDVPMAIVAVSDLTP